MKLTLASLPMASLALLLSACGTPVPASAPTSSASSGSQPAQTAASVEPAPVELEPVELEPGDAVPVDARPGARHLVGLDPETLAGWNLMSAEDDDFVLAWRVLGEGLVRNEYLELEVRLLREGQPVEGLELAVLGWMPDHGHGFQRRTEVEPLGPGSFHVKGVLFHMRGDWQLTFDVSGGERVDKLVHGVKL